MDFCNGGIEPMKQKCLWKVTAADEYNQEHTFYVCTDELDATDAAETAQMCPPQANVVSLVKALEYAGRLLID